MFQVLNSTKYNCMPQQNQDGTSKAFYMVYHLKLPTDTKPKKFKPSYFKAFCSPLHIYLQYLKIFCL